MAENKLKEIACCGESRSILQALYSPLLGANLKIHVPNFLLHEGLFALKMSKQSKKETSVEP